jgi:phosphoribosylformimino-5-aminoimidazole carboxamide ribotide isomerase
MLGPDNETAAKEALGAWKGGLQVGGGITEANAKEWIDYGAEKVKDSYLEVACRFRANLAAENLQ